MRDDSAKLSVRQHRLILALLQHGTIREAAHACRVSEATVFRWLKNDLFLTSYREARRQAVSQAIAALQQNAVEAVTTLQQIVRDESVVPGARLTAARTILDLALKGIELDDLEVRLEDLERRVISHID